MWILLRPELTAKPVVDAKPSRDEESLPVQPRRRGVTAMEYLVVASLIITVVIATVQSLGKKVGKSLTDSSNTINAANGASPSAGS